MKPIATPTASEMKRRSSAQKLLYLDEMAYKDDGLAYFRDDETTVSLGLAGRAILSPSTSRNFTAICLPGFTCDGIRPPTYPPTYTLASGDRM
eukprot:2328604-Pyramimonas_sp.AAC.2